MENPAAWVAEAGYEIPKVLVNACLVVFVSRTFDHHQHLEQQCRIRRWFGRCGRGEGAGPRRVPAANSLG